MRRKRNGGGFVDDLEFMTVLALFGGLAYLVYKGKQALPNLGQKLSQAVDSAGSSVADVLVPTPGGLNPSSNYEIPGTGQTVAELIALGYTQDEITQMMANATAQYGSPVVASPPQATDPTGYFSPYMYGGMPL